MNKAADALYSSGLFEVLRCDPDRIELLSTVMVYEPTAVVIGAGNELSHDDSGLLSTVSMLKRSSPEKLIFVVIKGTLECEAPLPEGVVVIRYVSSKQVAEEILVRMYTSDITQGNKALNNSLEREINNIVDKLCITPCYSGKLYIVEVLRAILSGEISACSTFSNDVYPMLANKFCVTPSSVQHCIHRAISESWKRMDADSKIKYFGALCDHDGVPGNRAYLMTLYDKLQSMGYERGQSPCV